MIKEYEYLHGVVFSRLCTTFDCPVAIQPIKEGSYSAFSLNNIAGLYIKYCGKRLSPWRFSLAKSHQDDIQFMYDKYGEVFIALVCHLDGIVLLNYSELKKILDDIHDENEWISVARRKNQMYSVAASNGELSFKISMNSCPEKVISFIKGKI